MNLAEECVDELMWLEDADDTEDKAHYNALMREIKALNERVNTGALFGENGTDGVDSETPEQKMERLTKERMDKDNIPYAEAAVIVMQSNPDLYREYNQQREMKE